MKRINLKTASFFCLCAWNVFFMLTLQARPRRMKKTLPKHSLVVALAETESELTQPAKEPEPKKELQKEEEKVTTEKEAQEQVPTKKADKAKSSEAELMGAMSTSEDDSDKIKAILPDAKETDDDVPVMVKKMEKVDREARRNRVISFVQRGIKYFSSHTMDIALHAMTHSKEFREGDLYLFVYNMKGDCLAHGQEPKLIWSNLLDLRDQFGAPVVQAMLEKGSQGSGWVTYHWRGATKVTYVEQVIKDGVPYIVGSGYYPQSKRDAVVNLVKGAVSLFNHVVKQGRPATDAFSVFNYPLGRFIKGDLYLFALDFDGIIVANGDEPRLVGSQAMEHKDSKGKYINKSIIAKLKETTKGIWIEYVSKNAPKVVYAEKVKDKDGKQFFIACGFYPKANRARVKNLVRLGYKFLKTSGLTAAREEFSPRSKSYRYGDLYLVVYSLKGVVMAHGGNEIMIGRNMYDAIDQSGHYYVREIIQKAEEGGGWVNYKLKNSFVSSYVEPVKLGTETFVILSSLFPVSKEETTFLLAESAASHYLTKPKIKALNDFVTTDGPFIKGDLGVFVIDLEGIFLANSDDYDFIWLNLLNAKDDNGKPFIKVFINTIKKGSGKVTYKLNGVDAVAFVHPVEKDGALYVVGSSYYL